MCVLKFKKSDKCSMLSRKDVGSALQGVLNQALKDRRLICGLLPAIAALEKASEDVLFCVLPLTRPGDATTHMQTVLLQAFCFENNIPVIQVDSGEKLAQFCGLNKCPCAVVIKDIQDAPLSPSEQQLSAFYECTLEEFPRPIVELPR